LATLQIESTSGVPRERATYASGELSKSGWHVCRLWGELVVLPAKPTLCSLRPHEMLRRALNARAARAAVSFPCNRATESHREPHREPPGWRWYSGYRCLGIELTRTAASYLLPTHPALRSLVGLCQPGHMSSTTEGTTKAREQWGPTLTLADWELDERKQTNGLVSLV
jgi:hypothetical protein